MLLAHKDLERVVKVNRGLSLLMTVAFGVIASYFSTNVISYFPATNQIVPTALVGLITLPVILLVQCLHKMTELEKISGVSASEQRRILPKIQGSKLFYSVKIGIIVIANLATLGLFFLAPSTLVIFSYPVINYGLALLGFMAVFSTVTVFECYIEIHTIQSFEAKVANRSRAKKAADDALAKLKPSSAK